MRQKDVLQIFGQISEAIDSSTSIDLVVDNILQAVIEIFNCDRAWLFHPCDPDAAKIYVLAEKFKDEYPGALVSGQELTLDQTAAETIRKAFSSSSPVTFGPGSDNEIDEVTARYSVLSQMMMAIHPKIGSPWMFGVHQCSFARIWEKDELIIFKEISSRVVQALNTIILLEEREKSEQKYRVIADSSPDMIYKMSMPDGGYDYVSPASENIFGYSPQEFYDTPILIRKTMHPDWSDYFNKQWALLLSGDMPPFYEYQIINKFGETRWLHQRNILVQSDSGKPIAIEGIVTDITEKKESELQLLKEKETAQRYLDISGFMFCSLNTRGEITLINKKGREILNVTEEETLGKNWFDHFLPKRMVDEVSGVFNKLMAGDIEPVEFYENPILTSDGRERLLAFHNSILVDPAGNIEGILFSAEDITERKQMEEEILRRRAEFEAIFSSITDAIVFVDLERRIIMINPTFTEMFGYQFDDIAGQTTQIIYANPDDFSRQGKLRYQKDVKIPQPVYENLYRRKDGTVFPGETLGVQVKNEQEEIMGFLGIIRDVSERKNAEKEKEHLEAQLRQAYKMEAVGTMAGGIAHDFNNILAIIIGNAEMALSEIPKDNLESNNIEQILIASNRARELVKQILAFSRRDEIKKIPLFLCDQIKDDLKLLRSTIPTTVSIVSEIDAECRPVLAVRTQINQLLMNLCTNAVHAMDEKGILKIQVREAHLKAEDIGKRQDIAEGDYVILTISDTGVGMDQETMERIFDPFYTTKEVGRGTGMGLSVVHGIVRNHNAMITVESELGHGTVFQVYFPTTEILEEDDVPVEEPIPTGSERILFVDDEEHLAILGCRMLQYQGYAVTAKTNSNEALEVFRAKPDSFDIVITDQTMPSLSGDELSVALLKIRPDIPIILCTGYSTKISEEKAHEIGIKEFCLKPLDRKSLAQKVRKVLDGKV